ncbi:phenylacetaldehyde reductase-like isoform X2 [Raphanus sativus]|uniref:Phenylacetaldehyde reductase-like isoform X2 n=1 Tax=Raphanus sativus TaxID=3726 RepID=A0A9W3D999_RAPSA|nr:phenylacetaldehyde reductase-like isoform X2 [Raphanus sativus]
MNGGGKVVCVTGASGYIASWIVKLLLLRGYTVRATVRNPSFGLSKIEHLLALEGAKERLKLFKADLLEECSFEQAIEGCDAVFHTASPVKFIVTDPQTELIDPAVKGTINVLNTCKKTSSVKRVILTSSTVAVLIRQPPLGPNDVVDETFFSDPNYCMETKFWYPLSKTLAENAAWQFAKDNGMDLIALVPGFIIGPLLQPTLNYSVEKIVDIINGKNPFYSINYRFVDVRDVALAHVKALETPSANGRYIMDGPSMTIYDIKETMRKLFPDLCIANTIEEVEIKEYTYKVDVGKVKSLGVEFTPPESSLRDTIVSLKEKCLL